MLRVTSALIRHEVMERTRDRWVLVVSLLFTVLALGVGLYGRSAGENAQGLIGPSLVTLVSLFVPLVALVLGHDAIVGERERNTLGLLLSMPLSLGELVFAKFAGRFLALLGAIVLGLGSAALFGSAVALGILGQTLLLGAAFLAIGVLISTLSQRQLTAASLVVSTWFLFVFFYDLGLLGLMIGSDGAISSKFMSWLVMINPAGLFRLVLLERMAGGDVLQNMGLTTGLPKAYQQGLFWSVWIAAPVILSTLLLKRRRVLS